MPSCSETVAAWAAGLRYEDLPPDVVEATKLRVLDVIGLALAGLPTPFGQSVHAAALAMGTGGGGPAHLWGSGEAAAPAVAAFANGALSQALEFDDTHNESIVHMSSPSVAAALALAEEQPADGRAVITAVALSNEIACRVGSVAPGQFHKRGLHPTGLFAGFGVACGAGWLRGLDAAQIANALGIAGSFAGGILQCWVDGTQSKFLHPGWAAHGGIVAALLGGAGTTGPAEVFEGRFGVVASHLQAPERAPDFSRITDGLGEVWESRRASFKPFPAAHVIHPYLDAILRLRAEYGITAAQVAAIRVPVAAYFVPIVCAPHEEKIAPRSDSHGRVSMQYSLAEALVLGRLGRDAYAPGSLRDPLILGLAAKVRCEVDPVWPGPERFKGAVEITLNDGRVLSAVEEHNRGSAENPMRPVDLKAKFLANAEGALSTDAARRVVAGVAALNRADVEGVGRLLALLRP